MKVFTVLALISFAIAANLLCSSEASNSTWGYIGYYDTLVYRELVVKKSSWLSVVTKDVVFPAKNHISYYTITCVKAIDHDRKNGGRAYLQRGGPGYRNATIHLKSERSYGLNFTVEIWGRQ